MEFRFFLIALMNHHRIDSEQAVFHRQILCAEPQPSVGQYIAFLTIEARDVIDAMRGGGDPAIADVGAAALVCEFVRRALLEVDLAGVAIGQGRVIGTVGGVVAGGRQYLHLPGRGAGTCRFAADNTATRIVGARAACFAVFGSC